MKKIFKGLIILLLAFPFIVKAQTYDITSGDMTIDLDETWYGFTRENYKGNETLKSIGVTEEYIENFFNNNSAYLDATKTDYSYEFIAVAKETEGVNNLSNYSDSDVNDFGKEIASSLNTDYKLYKNNYKYITLEYYDEASKYYIVDYVTVINAKVYTLIAQKEEAFTETEKAEIKKIVDTIKYNIKDEYKNEKELVKKDSKDSILPYIIIGAIVGGIAGGASVVAKNKKMKKTKTSEK